MTFSFGDPNDPRPDDKRFDTEEAAIRAAQEYQEEHDDILHCYVLAVWEDESGDVQCLVFRQIVYVP